MSELVSGLLVQLRGRALALQALTTSAVSLHDQCCDNLKHHQQHNTTDKYFLRHTKRGAQGGAISCVCRGDGRVAECVDRVCGVLREANRDEQQLLEVCLHSQLHELKCAQNRCVLVVGVMSAPAAAQRQNTPGLRRAQSGLTQVTADSVPKDISTDRQTERDRV